MKKTKKNEKNKIKKAGRKTKIKLKRKKFKKNEINKYAYIASVNLLLSDRIVSSNPKTSDLDTWIFVSTGSGTIRTATTAWNFMIKVYLINTFAIILTFYRTSLKT